MTCRDDCRPRWTAGNIVAMLVLMALAAVFLLPFAWSLSASLKGLAQVYAFPPTLTVTDPRWSNYPEALSRLPFGRFMLNTVLLCAAGVTGQLLTASMAGYAFARLRWKGRDAMFIVLLAGMMLPAQVLLVPHFMLYRQLDWVGTYKPLIVPSWLGGSAFFIFLFRQFFRAVPAELEQAARLDGASHWQVYWRIFLPLSKPVLITVGLLSLAAHWHEFMGPLIYLSDYRDYPVSMGLRMYQSLEGSFVHLLMAASLTATVPLLLLFLVAQRYFTRSLLLTGSKA